MYQRGGIQDPAGETPPPHYFGNIPLQVTCPSSSSSCRSDLFSRHLLMLAAKAARPTFVMEPQAEVCPVPVGILHVRPVGEIIEFHLFNQERPWHGGTAHRHTLSQTQRHTLTNTADRRRPGQRAVSPVTHHHRDTANQEEDCLRIWERERSFESIRQE